MKAIMGVEKSQSLLRGPVRVVFITFSFGSGGAEKQQIWMARTLARAGARCVMAELMVNSGNQRLSHLMEQAAKEGVEFSHAVDGGGYFSAWRRLRKLLRPPEPTVIWTWGFKADILSLLARPWYRSHVWFCSLRSASISRMRDNAFLIKFCSRWVTRYVSNTELSCDLLERVCAGARAKCRVIYNVVEELTLAPGDLAAVVPRPLRVVMLGNIVQPTKGYDLALDIGGRLQQGNRPVEIHIAGRPDAGSWLVDEIARRGLSTTVFYKGETGDPRGFLCSGHVYLLMSRFEGMPNALLEAASIGLPIIATRVGDLNRLAVDGKDMRLVDIGDVEGAYQAIVDMLNDWQAAVAMGQQGRVWCNANFNTGACEARLMEIVNEVLVTGK